jgi:YegS/Rv2252/BmrU family lipid kinase
MVLGPQALAGLTREGNGEMTGRRLLIIHNPVAGQRRARDYQRALAWLNDAGCVLTTVETTARGDATSIARDADTQAFDAVIAAGGDGTINEVVNGLVGGNLPLAVIPLGTSNVLAHEIGIGDSMRRAADAAIRGRAQPIALANAGGQYCCLMVSAGFDSRAMRRVRPALKKLLGEWAYHIAGIEEIIGGSGPMFAVEIDGARFAAASVIVANGRLYGGKYLCAPDADLREPVLQAMLLERAGRWNMIRYGWALMRNRLHRLADVRTIAGRKVRLLAPDGVPWQSDGDLLGEVPVTVTVEANAIEILMPVE